MQSAYRAPQRGQANGLQSRNHNKQCANEKRMLFDRIGGAEPERKESSDPFFRPDFPATDTRNWPVANVLKKSGNGVRFEQRPYQLPFFSPGFDVRDNLQVAW